MASHVLRFIRVHKLLGRSLLAGLVLLAGCATAPVQEMSDARQALLAAEEAGALEYADKTLANARSFLARAERALSAHQYAEAREQAELAKAAALEARALALERMQEHSGNKSGQ